MDFGAVLTKAWKIIWKHKILWLFGVLAGCGASMSGGGGGGGGGSSVSMSQSGNGPSFIGPSAQRALNDFARWITDIPVGVWVVVVLGIVGLSIITAIVFLFLRTLGTTGVIKGAALADEAPLDEKPISLTALFEALKPAYWKVLLLNAGVKVAGWIVGLFLVLPLILLAVCTCGFGLFLLIPLGWAVEVLITFTTIAIVDEDKPVFEAIGRAWRLMIRNLGSVAVMFLILGIGQLIAGLIIGLPFLLASVPLLINLFATGFQTFTVGLIITGVLFLFFLPVGIVLGGVLRAYVLSAWTLTYRRLALGSGLDPEVIARPKK